MIDHDKPVRVFRNWKRECYSIMQAGRVLASAREVRLTDVAFRVRESGRQRMLRLGRRNVHAYAVGYLADWIHPDDGRSLGTMAGRGVSYDPYLAGWFVDRETGAPVEFAAVAQFDRRGVTCRDAHGPASEPPRAA